MANFRNARLFLREGKLKPRKKYKLRRSLITEPSNRTDRTDRIEEEGDLKCLAYMITLMTEDVRIYLEFII